MRILAFVDTHGSEKHLKHIIDASHNADILVCAGDFTIFENDVESILRKLNSIGKPVLIIHGNHETSATIVAFSANLPNIHFIHKTYFLTNDLIFFGYGGGGFGEIDSKFDIVTEQLMKDFKDLEKKNKKEYRFVLVTHAPPYGTTLDDLGYHVGSKSIMKFIENEQPLITICGHIHECSGKQDKIKNTLAINPGPGGKIIEIEKQTI